MKAPVDWMTNLLATHGIWAVTALGTLAIVAAWSGLGALCTAAHRIHHRRRQHWSIRDLQHYANQPDAPRYALDQPRKENPQP